MDREAKPAINPVYSPIEISKNEVHFRVGPFKGAKHTISDADGDGVVADIVDQLDGTRTVAELTTEFDSPDEVRAVLEFLSDKNVLVDARGEISDDLRNYSLIAPETSAENADQARDSSVGIVARGEIGRMAASDLAEVGVREILVEDGGMDGAEPFESERVRRHEAGIESLIEKVDHVVYAAESPEFEAAREVNSLSFEHDTPLTVAHLLGMEGIIGPTVIPGKTPCYDCLIGHWARGAVSNADEETVRYFRSYLEDSRVDEFHLPSHRHLAVGVLTKELLSHLLTGRGYLSGRTFDVDFLTMAMETNEVIKNPRCDVCGARHDDYDRIVGTDVIEDG